MQQRYSEIAPQGNYVRLLRYGQPVATLHCQNDFQVWAAELIALGILIRREDGYLDQIGKHC